MDRTYRKLNPRTIIISKITNRKEWEDIFSLLRSDCQNRVLNIIVKIDEVLKKSDKNEVIFELIKIKNQADLFELIFACSKHGRIGIANKAKLDFYKQKIKQLYEMKAKKKVTA